MLRDAIIIQNHTIRSAWAGTKTATVQFNVHNGCIREEESTDALAAHLNVTQHDNLLQQLYLEIVEIQVESRRGRVVEGFVFSRLRRVRIRCVRARFIGFGRVVFQRPVFDFSGRPAVWRSRHGDRKGSRKFCLRRPCLAPWQGVVHIFW